MNYVAKLSLLHWFARLPYCTDITFKMQFVNFALGLGDFSLTGENYLFLPAPYDKCYHWSGA